MIGIIDYDAGNLRSVTNAFDKLEIKTLVTSSKEEIAECKAIVLPGVGSFGKAMESLKALDLIDPIKEHVSQGKYFLGICLGMQMLFEKSYEDGVWDGLGLIQGEVIRFETELKVPHMGWNQLICNKKDPIGIGIEQGEYVYYVHSYYAKPKRKQDVIFYSEYDRSVPGIVRSGNVIGMQFHPEKSAQTGIKLLKNFGELIK